MTEEIIGNLDISRIKRLQMPETTILIECPKCHEVMDVQLIDQLYYPGEGGCSVSFECEKCDIEVNRKIDIVSVVVTLRVHEPEIV